MVAGAEVVSVGAGDGVSDGVAVLLGVGLGDGDGDGVGRALTVIRSEVALSPDGRARCLAARC